MRKITHKPAVIKLLEQYRYLRLAEMNSLLNIKHAAQAVHQSRDNGWPIRTTKKGYTLRAKAQDYEFEMKLRCKNAKGNISNSGPLITAHKELWKHINTLSQNLIPNMEEKKDDTNELEKGDVS